MPAALILGGTGLVGRAVARRLLAAGWDVRLTGRNPANMPVDIAAAGGLFIPADRNDDAALAASMGAGTNLLVDCLCYTAKDAEQLLPFARQADSTVMISSKGVYVDEFGNHSNSDVKPNFGGPIRETQPTVAPSSQHDHNSREGYGANKVAAEQTLLASGLPVTILRPSKIHGAGALRPREWVFIKRVLDQRPAVLLANRGMGVDHTTAAANLAALIELAALKPGNRVLNSADPDAPSALGIARAIATHMGHQWEEVRLEPGMDASLGRTPWDAPHPIILDMTAALELGYVPVGDYATTVVAEIDWLLSKVTNERPARLPGGLDEEFFEGLFDYAAEDRFLAGRT